MATDRKTRGTQVVELAVVLPLLLFLSLAVSEGAYMIRVHQVLNNAAREGARLAVQQENYNPAAPLTNCATVTAGTSNAALCQAVISYAHNNGITPGSGANQCNGAAAANGLNVTINQNYSIPSAAGGSTLSGTQVTVICPYNLSFLPRLPSFGVTGTVNLKGNVVFRNFGW
jgi:Flp pilus assembly protein TadG